MDKDFAEFLARVKGNFVEVELPDKEMMKTTADVRSVVEKIRRKKRSARKDKE